MTDRSDDDVAARLATQAGELLLGVRDELADATAAERKAAGDKRSHDFLMEALASERPRDAVLSEEGIDNPIRLTAERVWIVDPLDGTREFSELGRDDWAVHVALWQAGELVAGAVALPAQGVTLATPNVAAPPAGAGQPADRRVPNPATRRRARGQGRPGRRARRDGFCGSQSRIGGPGHCRRVRARRRPIRMGFAPRRSRSPVRPGCTHRASTARRWSTTGPTRCCPI